MSLTNPVISTRHLTLGYQNKPVVRDITVDIAAGEFIGIFGPNGSGKSTFLRALLGLIQPLAGTIQALGTTPYRGHEKIGYMPQRREHMAIAHLTSRALLEATYHGTAYGLPWLTKTQKQAVSDILSLVGATQEAERPLDQLSGGEQQRIFLAQALLGHPTILLLDEPLANLDPHHQERFIHLLHDIQKNLRITILLSAHDPNPLLPVMTHVLYFAQQKAAIGTVQDVMTSATLTALYGTPIEVVHFKQRLFVLGEGQYIHSQESSHHV